MYIMGTYYVYSRVRNQVLNLIIPKSVKHQPVAWVNRKSNLSKTREKKKR